MHGEAAAATIALRRPSRDPRLMTALPGMLDDIAELVVFIERRGAGACIDFRRGAALDEIERFADRVGWPLPPLYRGYLQQFGAEPARLYLGRDGSSALDRLLRFYASKSHRPERGVVIVTPAIEPAMILLYEDRQTPPAVTSWWGDEAEPIASPSFAHHLYRCGWLAAHWSESPQLTARELDLDAADPLLESLGLERQWFSGPGGACFERPRGATWVHLEPQGDVLRAFVWSRERSRGAEIVERLERTLGMRRVGGRAL